MAGNAYRRTGTTGNYVPYTVGALAETLKDLDPDAEIVMWSDAEGNREHPLFEVSDFAADEKRVYLVPFD